MHNVTQPYQKVQIAPFVPSAARMFSGMHAVQNRADPRHILYACQFEPPMEGGLQVVDRFMLQDLGVPPANVFEVRNLQRQPPSAYLCSYQAADLRRAQDHCLSELMRSSNTPKTLPQAVSAPQVVRDISALYPGTPPVALPTAVLAEAVVLTPKPSGETKAPAKR